MKKTILKISGMSCSACSNTLEKYLKKNSRIIDATVNLVMAEALILHEDDMTIDEMNEIVKEAGFISLGEYDPKAIKKEAKKANNILIFFCLFTIVYFYVSMGHMIKLPTLELINPSVHPLIYGTLLFALTIPYLVYAKDIFKIGYKNLIHLSLNMDTLVSLGVIVSFLYSVYGLIRIYLKDFNYVHNLYFESAAFVIFFVRLGRFIDGKSKMKTKKAIEELVQITPEVALLKKGKKVIEVTIDEVKVGDVLIAKPGMKIAVDGKIVKGSTHIDEAFITGESIPDSKKVGDSVYAGSINVDGMIEYKAEKIGANSSISEIVHLVVEATNTKAPIAKVADKVSGYFVPFIIIIAILSFIFNLMFNDLVTGINTLVTVLVVACPCALGLATPLAIVVAMGKSSENGILIKSSSILENTSKIDTIVFDKTGTLTNGTLNIEKVFNYSNLTQDQVLSIVANAEKSSNHPISKAFKKYETEEEYCDFKEIVGEGIEVKKDKEKIYIGNKKILKRLKIKNIYVEDEEYLSNRGCSVLYLIKNKEVLSLIGVRDTLRSNAKRVIKKLKKMNYQVILLSGDNENVASIIGKELGIEKVIADVLPKDKTEVIKKLEQDGHFVMMVGDGINDAPSLALSTVGISISSASEIASSSADVILVHDNLNDIINLIKISKKTILNIRENLFWAFFYNILMIPIALGALSFINIKMNPMIASLAMTLSSLTVVLNSLRIRNVKMAGDFDV